MIDLSSLFRFKENPNDFGTMISINNGNWMSFEMCQDMAAMHDDCAYELLYADLGVNSNLYNFFAENYPKFNFKTELENGKLQKKYLKYCIEHIDKEAEYESK